MFLSSLNLLDKVATHVYRSKHDRNYLPDLPDDGGIEHVYIEKFEHFNSEENVETFVSEHGPIDIVLGGKPSVGSLFLYSVLFPKFSVCA